MIHRDQVKVGDRVRAVTLWPSKPKGYFTQSGSVVGFDSEDDSRLLVMFDGSRGHISHPLLEILESE